MPRRPLLMLLVCLLLSPAMGQTRAAPQRQKAAAGDQQIEAAIRARFARSKIGKNDFGVRVQGGVATLDGQTDVVQHKGTATRLAKSAGAVRVVNRIRVSQAARERAAASLAKGRRRAQVKRGEAAARSEPRTAR